MGCRNKPRLLFTLGLATSMFLSPEIALAEEIAAPVFEVDSLGRTIEILGQERVLAGTDVSTRQESRIVALPDKIQVSETKVESKKAEKIDRLLLQDEKETKGFAILHHKTFRVTDYQIDSFKRTKATYREKAEQERLITMRSPVYTVTTHCRRKETGLRYVEKTRMVQKSRTVTDISWQSMTFTPDSIVFNVYGVPQCAYGDPNWWRKELYFIRWGDSAYFQGHFRNVVVIENSKERTVQWLATWNTSDFENVPGRSWDPYWYCQMMAPQLSIPPSVPGDPWVVQSFWVPMTTPAEMDWATIIAASRREAVIFLPQGPQVYLIPTVTTRVESYQESEAYQEPETFEYQVYFDKAPVREEGALEVSAADWLNKGVKEELVGSEEELFDGDPYPLESYLAREDTSEGGAGIGVANMPTQSKAFASNTQIGCNSGRVTYSGAKERSSMRIDEAKVTERKDSKREDPGSSESTEAIAAVYGYRPGTIGYVLNRIVSSLGR